MIRTQPQKTYQAIALLSNKWQHACWGLTVPVVPLDLPPLFRGETRAMDIGLHPSIFFPPKWLAYFFYAMLYALFILAQAFPVVMPIETDQVCSFYATKARILLCI